MKRRCSPASSDVVAQRLNLRTVYSFVFHFRCIKLYSGLVMGTFIQSEGFHFGPTVVKQLSSEFWNAK